MAPLLGIYAFFFASICASVQASNLYGGYSKHGCFSSLSGWQSMGSSKQQTAGTCGGKCSDNNFPLFALSGSQCYCGSAFPPSSDQSSSGSCNTPCDFYPSDTCGSQGAFVVYQISGKQASTAAASSAAPTSQSSSQDTESSASATDSSSAAQSTTAAANTDSSSNTPSTTSASPSSAASSPSTTAASTTSSQSSSDESSQASSQTAQSTSSAQTVTVTASSSTNSATSQSSQPSSTSSPSSSQSSSTSSSASSSASSSTSTNAAGKLNPKGKDSKSKSGISGGAIAGIVVGVVVGVVVIAALIILLCLRWRHRDREDEYYSPSSSPNELKSSIGSFHNPYPERPVVDQRLNPAMLGDPRISIASLADARDYSRQILKVANPDEKSMI